MLVLRAGRGGIKIALLASGISPARRRGREMNEPTVILANLPEPDAFPALARSINAAFGPSLRAAVEDQQLVLESHGTRAAFDATGECVGVAVRPTPSLHQ